jgi:hypothetical protein
VVVASRALADAAVAALHLLRDPPASSGSGGGGGGGQALKPPLVRRGGYLQCQVADAHGYRTTKSRRHHHAANTPNGPQLLTAADADPAAGSGRQGSEGSSSSGGGRAPFKRALGPPTSTGAEVVVLGSGRQLVVGQAGQPHDYSAAGVLRLPSGRQIVVGEQGAAAAGNAYADYDEEGAATGELLGEAPAAKKLKGPHAAKAPKAPPMEAKDIKVMSFAELMEKKRQGQAQPKAPESVE